MKTLKTNLLFTTFFLSLLWCGVGSQVFAQCQPMIIIDGNNIVADENATTGIKLPSWLKAAQTLNIGQYVYSIAVIEFSVNGTALDYSQNLSITAASTVPANKVWKIEAIHKNPTLPTFSGTYTYATAGTFTFTAPPCISTARIQMWSGGGGGGGSEGSGGGGGGYAEGYYLLTASTSYTVVVGAGGAGAIGANNGAAGGTSSFGTGPLISVTGGAGGVQGPGSTAGGNGGVGSGQLNFTGNKGGNSSTSRGGDGGNAANGGGVGGADVSGDDGNPGTTPGGGGAGGDDTFSGGDGAAGKVVITFGLSSSTIPCVTLYQYSSTACTALNPAPCPSGFTDGGCGYGGYSNYTIRTCYRCD